MPSGLAAPRLGRGPAGRPSSATSADRQVDVERRPPSEPGDEHRAERRTGRYRKRADPPHSATTCERRSFGKAAEQAGPATTGSIAAAPIPGSAARRPAGPPTGPGRREPSRGRRRASPAKNDRPAAESVGGSAGHDQQRTEHDAVAGDHPGQSPARDRVEKDRSRAGKATLTIERSSEAMNAPRAVTKNTRRLRDAGEPGAMASDGSNWGPPALSRLSCVMELSIWDCV